MQIAAREMVWGGKPIDKWWLCFTAEQDNSTVAKSFPSSQTYETSTNGMSWRPYTSGAKITLSKKGNKVYFRAGEGGNTVATGNTTSYRFVMSGKIAASGNIMSLLNGEVKTEIITSTYAFANLFYRCTSLITAPELPATTLAVQCYRDMFLGCTSLAQAPELPATELAVSCYSGMFVGCVSLVDAPGLPARGMAEGCYSNMFDGCTSLVDAPELPATTLAPNCYNSMFLNCTSLVTAPELPATKLVRNCYTYMFYGCTSLTQAPKLPATTLAGYCYYSMFRGCTSLVTAPELPATTLANNCYHTMFGGCTSLTSAPELPATTLIENCYASMFQYCANLRSVKAKFKSFDNVNNKTVTGGWLNGVSKEGVFECYSELGTNETIARGTSACPEGWTVVNEKSVTEYVTIDTEDVHSFEWTPTGFIDYIDNYAVTVPSTVIADILVVGGGGAGANPGNASNSQGGAGGGGAGGMIEAQSVYLEAGSYDIIVGRGGISPETQGKGGSGKPSKILLSGSTKYEAFGGGGGGIKSAGESGGSGGGGSKADGGSGTSGQGFSGGDGEHNRAGGGGGGAGGAGYPTSGLNKGGAGGEGKTSIITGAEIYYAAGGGGGSRAGTAAAAGGSEIGGDGGYNDKGATSGKKNTGSGGGGGSYNFRVGGDGGSGIVIIRIHKVMPIKPNAAYEFSYDGESHLLYEGGRGVTITKDGKEVSEIAEKDVGTYNYTVTLKDGYKWDDLTENKMISVTVTVSVPSIQ